MKIGAVAELLSMPSSTIRYYEQEGLIKPIGRVAGRREFDEQSILTLRFLKVAQSAGFALSEIRQLLDMGFGEERRDEDWLTFLKNKRSSVKAQIQDLYMMDDMLSKFEVCKCTSLSECMTASAN